MFGNKSAIETLEEMASGTNKIYLYRQDMKS